MFGAKIFGENIFGDEMFGGFFSKSPKISVNNFVEKGIVTDILKLSTEIVI